ncbi:MAG: hypothetical protein ACREGB_03045, partial [Candidatus Saccharimonadales bacterium]
MAARAMGVNVQPRDVLYIRAASRLAAVADDMVDNEGLTPDIEAIIRDPVAELAGRFSDDDEKLVTSAITALTPFHHDAWMKAVDLPLHAQAKRRAATAQKLSEALTAESELFSSIFSLDITSGPDRTKRKAYN